MTSIDTRSSNQDRANLRAAFLHAAGWADARVNAVAGDASSRSYERLTHNGRTVILMNAPPGAESAACPVDATPETRKQLGYNAMARLAGPNLHAFLEVSKALRHAGLSAPEIIAADPDHGFALMEDLGDDLYARAISGGADEYTLYETAVDALFTLHRSKIEPPSGKNYQMLTYDPTAMAAEIALLPEWYMPFRHGTPESGNSNPEFGLAFAAAFDDVLADLPAPSTIVLRDYHAENLLWLPARQNIQRVGVIDFQDGLFGHASYDLVSLLEDARRDVCSDLAAAMFERYAAMSDADTQALRAEYAILGAQRNAKILGIFARLVVRDAKPRYADLLPRVEAHFRRNIAHPALRPVKDVIASALPEFS